ncbi:MAG: VirB3 family type IV secretion system protein [Proteobacteria bacterium]|nr:VirB3 family type IV secretion system protein [Candidatus Enterousia scatequi]
MKQQVLKALANPARIFYVPYSLAVINFVVQFVIFIVVFVLGLVIWKIDISPLWFLISVILVHFILMGISKRDPQIGQIISAKIQLMKHRIPKRLTV